MSVKMTLKNFKELDEFVKGIIDSGLDEEYVLRKYEEIKKRLLMAEKNICNHCKMDIEIRNPSGFCDHLYYPDNCDTCKANRIVENPCVVIDLNKLQGFINTAKKPTDVGFGEAKVMNGEFNSGLDKAMDIIRGMICGDT